MLSNKAYKDGLIFIPVFRECQSLDPFCNKILNDLLGNPSFYVKQGILCKRQIKNDEIKDLLVLPTNLLPILRNALHYSIMGNHSSTDIIYRKLKEHYFHQKLRDKLKEIGENCILCAINKPSYGKKLSLGEKIYPKAPRIGYSFDIACGYPAINSYKCHIIIPR